MKNNSFEDCWSDYEALILHRPELFRTSELLPIVTDKEQARAFHKRTGQCIGVIYKSPYHILLVDLIDGKYTYERLIPAMVRGAVVIVAVKDGKYILLKQYRHALRDFEFSFPRGFGEQGISPEENARKELAEEIGADVISMEYIGSVAADSGILGTKVDIFYCEISDYTTNTGIEGIVEIIEVSPNEMDKMISSNEISDGYTLSAYFLSKMKL